MATSLVIERPRHVPRFLGRFLTRTEAENVRRELIDERPNWRQFLYLVDHDESEPKQTR